VSRATHSRGTRSADFSAHLRRLSRRGRARRDAAALIKPPRDLTRRVSAADEQRTAAPSIRIGKGQMPAFGGLMADDEIADVIAFVRTLVPPGTLPPRAAAPAERAPLASPPTAQGSP
jgi:mono/diheme cytochrome c family protein